MSRAIYTIVAIMLILSWYLVERWSPGKSTAGATSSAGLLKDYATARPLFWSKVYPEGGVTLYCGEQFNSSFRSGFNIEHVFPMSWVKNALQCGTRKQCQQRSPIFNRIEADLHNLYPSRVDTNQDRASFRYGEIDGEQRHYGRSCDFEVDSRARVVEPANAVRGDIARAMFYMADQYKSHGLAIFAKQARLLHSWHLADPPSDRERLRNQQIEYVQGNRNPFIDDPQSLDRLVKEGYFF